MPKADAEEEFVENPKSGSRKKKKKAPGTESSSRKPKNEGALVAYDEEKASKAKRDQPQSDGKSDGKNLRLYGSRYFYRHLNFRPDGRNIDRNSIQIMDLPLCEPASWRDGKSCGSLMSQAGG